MPQLFVVQHFLGRTGERDFTRIEDNCLVGQLEGGNGVTTQSASTSLLIHSVPALIEAVSAVMTLLPGDVILTGTPAGVGPLASGDEVAVTVSGLGTLVNPVR